jgi:hypothetical protein
MRKLQLAPLPARPSDAQASKPRLRSDVTVSEGVGSLQASDRYLAPDFKDYTQIYRVGRSLILPSALNGEKVKLFILDVSVGETTVSPAAAKEVSKVHEKDLAGRKLLVADEITFNFAHFSQKLNGVVASDTAGPTLATGMEISGYIGANTYQQLIMHLDYRDGLVKFDYIPNRGYKFE